MTKVVSLKSLPTSYYLPFSPNKQPFDKTLVLFVDGADRFDTRHLVTESKIQRPPSRSQSRDSLFVQRRGEKLAVHLLGRSQIRKYSFFSAQLWSVSTPVARFSPKLKLQGPRVLLGPDILLIFEKSLEL